MQEKQKVTINNPDNDGWIRLSNTGLSRLDATTTGVDVYGVLKTTGNADINGTCTCSISRDLRCQTETNNKKML